jgi:MoaA/NifB/PqqE/SkfB family radical SAM enzyme
MKNILKKIRNITTLSKLNKFLSNTKPKVIGILISNDFTRKILIRVIDSQAKKSFLKDKRFPQKVNLERYYITRALINSLDCAISNAKNKEIKKPFTELVIPSISKMIGSYEKKEKKFLEKHNIYPTNFITISPGKFCNLKCKGCYANSDSASAEKLNFEIVDRIITEKTKEWGSWFTVVSGGEPFAWKSKGKDLIELAKKHPNNWFMIYTNGTLITDKLAKKIAKVGNISPAISVEGFEKETDARRGKGVYKKIMEAMENLQKYGVPYGISVTATKENANMIATNNFWNYYFKNKKISYAWIFQLMPIGRGSIKMMITPEQRKKLLLKTNELIREKKYFIADFWNSGTITSGCISAGKKGGYFYIEWNGNITPCVFNPYAIGNINDYYKQGKSLNDILKHPLFRKIRKWQKSYGAMQTNPRKIKNWLMPCPIKDHYKEMKKILTSSKVTPIDCFAEQAIKDKKYEEEMDKMDKKVQEKLDPIWEDKYISTIED